MDLQDFEDVQSQLAQKERDLLLAAQLGKALLEKNEELSMQNEKIVEDFSRKLEVLEQEKYVLRRKLESVESEYESKVTELQGDVAELQKCVEDQQTASKTAERQKAAIITELTEQNQRLTNQLKEAMKNEEQLTLQVQALRDQFSMRKSSLQDHVSHLEIMKEEIMIITEKKQEVERRLNSLLAEREGLSSNLDESTDRILLLERQCREQDIQLRQSQRELAELRVANGVLCERIESLSRQNGHLSASFTGNSLLAEMDLSGMSSGHGSASASSPHSHPSLNDDIEIDEMEYRAQSSLANEEQTSKMKEEILFACNTLRALCDAMRQKRRRASSSLSSLSSSSNTSNSLNEDIRNSYNKEEIDQLSYWVKEIDALVRGSATFQLDLSQCGECGRSPTDIMQFESELHLTQEASDKLQRTLADKTEELKRCQEETTNLRNQLTLKQVELEAVREERDTARQDARDTNVAKDELVKRAWEVRDQAVARKNKAEIDLARTRIDVLQINSQLMEAVQQKIELSQQLDQWQLDMQQLLDDQMRRKLSKQEILRNQMAANATASPQPPSPEKRRQSNKFLSLFQRS